MRADYKREERTKLHPKANFSSLDNAHAGLLKSAPVS